MGAGLLARKLLAWYDSQKRDLPWRREPLDPYRVLVSEIMLQQTRASVVAPYYERFLRLFPTVRALARARPSAVLRAWAGLGYYARARHLHSAARSIARHGFPSGYEELRTLPGIGPYTAAAISSIAFGRPHAVLDGNVRRVLGRLLCHPRPGQREADRLLDHGRPGDYNQALMELGSTICLPRQPQCSCCPLARFCLARQKGRVHLFPPRRRKRAVEELHLKFALVRQGVSVLLEPPGSSPRRTKSGRGGDPGSKGLWPGFWNLPEAASLGLERQRPLGSIRHTVTFRRIRMDVVAGQPSRIPAGLVFVSPARLARLPLSTPARKALAAFPVSATLPARGKGRDKERNQPIKALAVGAVGSGVDWLPARA